MSACLPNGVTRFFRILSLRIIKNKFSSFHDHNFPIKDLFTSKVSAGKKHRLRETAVSVGELFSV